MLDSLTFLVREYGLLGLLFSSLMGSTIFFPFSIEISFPVLVRAGVHRIAIIWFASVGALAGTYINYLLGYLGIKYVYEHTRKEELGRARHFMDRYGWAGIFMALVLPVPLPVDPLTILCGIAKMNPFEFAAVVFSAKIIKYSIILGVLSFII